MTSAIREDVLAAIEAQVSVIPLIHRVIGAPLEDDAHRWQTIARARNEGKKLGSSPWLMFVDDDVVLGRGCVAELAANFASPSGVCRFRSRLLP